MQHQGVPLRRGTPLCKFNELLYFSCREDRQVHVAVALLPRNKSLQLIEALAGQGAEGAVLFGPQPVAKMRECTMPYASKLGPESAV